MSAQKAAEAVDPSPSPAPEPSGAEVPIMGRALPWILAVGGGIGLLAAFALAIEKVNSLANPDYVPTCSVNPVISCGTVMDTPTAEAFGFPNPLLGIACFAIVTAIGMAMLAGASFRPWFWWGLQGGVIFGIGFVHFLIFQSLYKISALCPYCMVVWAVMIPIFTYVTLDNVRTGRIPLPAGARSAAGVLIRNHTVVVTVWFLLIIAAIAQAFWSFWTGQI